MRTRAARIAGAVTALTCIAGAPAFGQSTYLTPNAMPLTFGMTVDEASQALGVPLNHVRGRPGDGLFLAIPNVRGSALSSRSDGLYLQFRKGRLAGWKGDWGTIRP
ncbi:MAG: hypothetical protein ACRECL_11210 [Bradyrhizobium sp.]